MSSRLKDLPGVPTKLDTGLRNLLLGLVEQVRELRGFDGDPTGKAVTGSGVGGGITTVIPGAPPPPAPAPSPTPDLTPPPTVGMTGGSVVAGPDFIGITTDAPTFTQGHGYARTVVYGAKWNGIGSPPTFASAVVVHEFVGEVGSFPTDFSTEWHIWLKWKTVDGVVSALPAGGTNGFTVTTGQNMSLLLQALTGLIMSSELHTSLSTPISLITAPASTPGSVDARIATETAARTSADAANASSISTVSARLNTGGDVANSIVAVQSSASAAQTSANNAQSTANAAQSQASATASQVTTLQSTVNGNTASIAQEITTRANQTGYLGAQYTLRLDVGGRVVGFGISSTSAPGAQPTSDFQIVADRFSVVPPAGVTGVGSIVPFAVQATPVTTPAGELLPAGVYINAAFIRNLEAALGRFQQAVITNAMIVSLSATKITAGAIAVGEYIQSSGYVPGSSGWRILGNGNAELSNLLARGSINGGGFSGYAWPADGSTGFHLGPSGLLLGNANIGRYFQVSSDGNVYAPQFTVIDGNASFSGSLNVGPDSGQRTKITNAGIRVFNSAGVEVITLGIF